MSSNRERAFLPANFMLEPALLELLSSRPGHQRVVVGEHECLLVFHEVPEPGVPERRARFLWRRADGHWVAEGGEAAEQELNGLFDCYGEAIDLKEEQLEDATTAREVFEVLRHAAPLARSTRNLAVALEQALTHDVDDPLLLAGRDRMKELERAAELLLADARTLLEFRRAEAAEDYAEASERLAKAAFRLNLLAGFFLPLVALAGLLGMNIDLPGWLRSGFWAVVLLGLALGGVLLALLVGRGEDR